MTAGFYEGTAMGAGFRHNPVLAVQRRQLAALVTNGSRDAYSVLDLGCGAGTTTSEVFGGDSRMHVIGADLSPTALRAYADTVGRPAVQVDATRLPFGSASFDVVISDDVVEHLVDTDSYRERSAGSSVQMVGCSCPRRISQPGSTAWA